MHKVFISHHHENDQWYKNELVKFGEGNDIFVDRSVDTGDIPDDWTDQQIRRAIRDNYLRDSTVTIVLVGMETKRRKHVDWEIHSSMYDGSVNKRSGIVVINLPGITGTFNAPYGDREKALLYSEVTSWTHVDNRTEYERRYPYMPDRIVDNLLQRDVTISVAPWDRINGTTLEFLIESAFRKPFQLRIRLAQADATGELVGRTTARALTPCWPCSRANHRAKSRGRDRGRLRSGFQLRHDAEAASYCLDGGGNAV